MKIIDKYEIPYSGGTWIVAKEMIPIIIGGKGYSEARLFQDLSKCTITLSGLKDVLKKNVDPKLFEEDRIQMELVARNLSQGCIKVEALVISKI